MNKPSDTFRALVARRLERGTTSRLAGLASMAWTAWSARTVARPLRLPRGVQVIGVGGAVLGGAGKTPVAIALARALADRGERVALVGHAYRATPEGPRVVLPGDAVARVGDDALAAARLLGEAATVLVGPTRQAAIDHAAALGHRVIVVDGLLQAAPERLAASVLVLDALAPWGSGGCPPAGDLRAPRSALLAAADLVGAIQPEGTLPDASLPPSIPIPSCLAGAVVPSGEHVPLTRLAGLRVGLVLAIARPDRIVEALARAGVRPLVTLRLADHATPDVSAMRAAPVDAWLATARCATKLPDAIGPAPVLALDHRVDVAALVTQLITRGWGTSGGPC